MANAGPDQVVNENATVTLSGTATDPDVGEKPSYTWTQVGGPILTLLNSNTPHPTFHISSNMVHNNVSKNAPLTFLLIVNDGIIDSKPSFVKISVNHPPKANQLRENLVTTMIHKSLNIMLTGNDPDADPLRFSIVSGPYEGTLGPITTNGSQTNSATVIYTPQTNFNGSDSFTFKVSDGRLDSSPAEVLVKVNRERQLTQTQTIAGTNISNSTQQHNLIGEQIVCTNNPYWSCRT